MRDPLGERGSSTVELALVMPLLLIVLVGAVQFALVYHAKNVAGTAVQEGARVAASEGASADAGAARTREVLTSGLGQTGSGFQVSAEDTGETVVTRAVGEYELFIPWVAGRGIPIEARAEVRKEGFRSGP